MNKLHIESIPLFNSLPNKEIDYLNHSLKQSAIESDTILFREGELGDKFFIIASGYVEIVKALGTREEQILGERGPGDFFGEMSLLLPDQRRTASIRAISSVELLELSRNEFDLLLERRPALACEMVRVLTLRLRASDNVMIRDLKEKNKQLEQAYEELKAAQAQIVAKEKLEHELSLARNIQESILPNELNLLKGYDFGACMLPARAVGGDLYDFIPIDENLVGISIGDVSDKGVPAAIFMALYCSVLRAESHHGISCAEVLRKVNQHLLGFDDAGMFVTALYGVLNKENGEFSYARAGHHKPLLFDQHENEIDLKMNPGQLLGFFPDPQIDEQIVRLKNGHSLVIYTDGVIDAMNADDTCFGLENLKAIVRANIHGSSQDLCDMVMEDIRSHQGPSSQFDDITLVAIKSDQ